MTCGCTAPASSGSPIPSSVSWRWPSTRWNCRPNAASRSPRTAPSPARPRRRSCVCWPAGRPRSTRPRRHQLTTTPNQDARRRPSALTNVPRNDHRPRSGAHPLGPGSATARPTSHRRSLEHSVSSTMRAYVSGENTPLTLTDRPVPTPGHDEVLIRTRAAALNNSDLTPSGDDHVAGFEFAGDIIDVGTDAPAQLHGARVMGIASAALAEMVVAHHRHVVVMPETVSYEEAATLPTALATEHGALTLGEVGPATSVLITAASSGIGVVGVQLAALLGASTIVATTRSPQKRSLLEQLGANAVVVTTGEDLAAGVRAATGGDGARVVLDHIGGDALADAVEAASDGGNVISVGRLGGARGSLDLFTLARRYVTLRSVSYGLTPPSVLGDLFDGLTPAVLPAIADRRIRAVIDSAYAFDDARSALERLASGQAAGKVALNLD